MSSDEAARRRDQIVNLLSAYGELSAKAMAEMLQVTVQTIRSDLRALDDAALVRRRHGLARLAIPQENIGYQPRLAVSRSEKERIGAAVAALVPDGASIALGTGTTVEAVARALAGHEALSVATNNLHAVLALRAAPKISVSLAGGRVRMRDLDLIGAEASEFYGNLRLQYAVFSVGGVSLEGDLLDFNMDEVRARRAIAGCAGHRILVVDHAKIGRAAGVAMGQLSELDTVVCGGALPETLISACKDAGTRVIVA
ncbi:DeoR/GlpR family DNA-binding transcription regulator [Salipiger bermudensis]|uniref:DeoR/GlpR family DNA-binding transcription regulator n=1 Tax=Salipiger bermudensis TaxID=344736 RepID=UPI001C996859|nr:DeoR/GlpR family DNA-binding transcription regulator [Salipiger bermudensis]MBY6006136.1 DeoR/GlpR family DNA-binding transcription regulator [Salipiger bermudensis]